MTDTLFVNKVSTTPSSGVAIDTSSLPPELLAEASRRLGLAGLVYACTYALAYFGPRMVASLSQPEHGYSALQNWTAIVSIALGVGLFGLSQRARLSPVVFLNFGLVFFVVGALGIAMAEFSRGFVATPFVFGEYHGVPWEALWIILFPLVAPNLPNRILVAALLAASMGPVILVFVAAGGTNLNAPVPTLISYFLFTNYLCAGLAYVIARIIIRYGVRLKRAREIGSYELVRELGTGGMGAVWVARHRLLTRPAAVKIVRPELLGADARSREVATRRFEREARATAALGSMHTVSIYDFGVTDQGAFYYVMELLDGFSLEDLVKRYGPVDSARAVYLMRQVCHSLGDAHQHRLIHRDIKPANVFVCRLGPDFDFVKVLDFGLVKTSADVVESVELTAEGITAGTPAYMAPEMAVASDDVDGRTDIYAAGCVAYWLITGQPVFEAETPVATILKHVREKPVPPSQRTEMPIPPGLEAVILACLAKDPADRPQTAAELSLRLQASLCGDPWSHYDARQWWERHRPHSDADPSGDANV